MVSPFLSQDFKKTIITLRRETIDNIKNRFTYYGSDWHRMSECAREYAEQDIQLEVIDSLRKEYTQDLIREIISQAQQWVTSKEGIIRQYLRSTEKETEERLSNKGIKFVKQRYVKVVTKCNSHGGDEVEKKDLNQWIDTLIEQVSSTKHRKILIKSRTQVRNNLARMIAFPVSIKETIVSSDLKEGYVSEMDFLMDMEKAKLYVPESAKQLSNLYSKLLVTLNGVRYLTPKGNLIEEAEVRLKLNEQNKMGKFTTGVRDFPHYDGDGARRIVRSVLDIPDAYKSVLSIGLTGEVPEVSYRFNGVRLEPTTYSKQFPLTMNFLKESRQNSENELMYVLSNPYVDAEGNILRSLKNKVDVLVTGIWMGMKDKISKGPLESQIRDSFADLIYGWNSPIGHNSIDYDWRRNEECKTKISVVNEKTGKKEQITLPTQLILDYQVNEILRPAFSTLQL
jgi:hypothetical protein